MAFTTRVTVYPDVPVQAHGGGGFLPTSFHDLLQTHVTIPGLDPTWRHLLVDVEVAPDRNSAELTLHSEPMAPLSLDRNLRIDHGHPPARIKAHDTTGAELACCALPAPLQPGQAVEIAGKHYRVGLTEHHEMWPHRDPETGRCKGAIDWQHVTLHPDPQPPHVPVAAED